MVLPPAELSLPQLQPSIVERTMTPRFSREELLRTLLLERLSLRVIARILQVSLEWVTKRAKQRWQAVPQQLPTGKIETAELALYCVESDEMWSFVGAKVCPEWIWLAIERRTRLVVGFHIGGRDQEGALGLWFSIPQKLC